MKSTKTTNTVLELTEAEAEWLKAIMQNPIYVEDPESEEEYDKKHRHTFWEALGGNFDGLY